MEKLSPLELELDKLPVKPEYTKTYISLFPREEKGSYSINLDFANDDGNLESYPIEGCGHKSFKEARYLLALIKNMLYEDSTLKIEGDFAKLYHQENLIPGESLNKILDVMKKYDLI
ncbi:hypothetical protein GOV11_00255 [Candidatus Woesearchaeota archaeon]|nr:hypothetical protein [Candidatus Woesearchaeota archaeon]